MGLERELVRLSLRVREQKSFLEMRVTVSNKFVRKGDLTF